MRIGYATFCVAPAIDSTARPAWDLLPGGAQFQLLRESVNAIENQPKFTVLTDQDTPFGFSFADTEIERRPVNRQEMMLERTRRQAGFLEKAIHERPVVFADTDMLLISPLGELFRQDFDIALTVRNRADMPINGGLILANSRRPEKTLAFFKETLAIMEGGALADCREWYGDQYALYQMLEDIDIAGNIGKIVESRGFRILLLDAERYNYSPRRRRPRLDQDLSSIALYHFKGEHKAYMPFFWENRIKPRILAPAHPRFGWLVSGLLLELARKRMKKAVNTDRRRLIVKQPQEGKSGT